MNKKDIRQFQKTRYERFPGRFSQNMLNINNTVTIYVLNVTEIY